MPATTAALLPLLVAAPILSACLLLALHGRVSRPAANALVLAVSAASTAAAGAVLIAASGRTMVAWIGDWRPHSRPGGRYRFGRGPILGGTGGPGGFADRLRGPAQSPRPRRGRYPLRRAAVDLPGGDERLRAGGGPVQPVRVLRADGCGRLRTDRNQDRGPVGDPGRAQLRHHPVAQCLPDADRHHRALRARRPVGDGPARCGAARPARRPGGGRLRAGVGRAVGQGRHRAAALLAGRRARRGTGRGVRVVLRGHGRTGSLRAVAGVLGSVRGCAAMRRWSAGCSWWQVR